MLDALPGTVVFFNLKTLYVYMLLFLIIKLNIFVFFRIHVLKKMEAVGKFDFTATANDELSFRKGESIKVRFIRKI